MSARFDPAYPVERLRPAPYNPRAIDEEAEVRLRESVRLLGVCKPVIVTDDGTIVAGHQRTRALRALGLATVPAVLLGAVSEKDEVRFNQLHNGADLGGDGIEVPPQAPGFAEVEPPDVRGSYRQRNSTARVEVGRLILKYGGWGAGIALPDGRVIGSGQYVLACRAIGVRARVYTLDAAIPEATARGFLDADYGRYSYDHIPRHDWIQTLAQPSRHLEWKEGTRRRVRSVLYEDSVFPTLRRDERLLDFGAGQGTYADELARRGFPATAIEFYRRPPGDGTMLDTAASHAMIDAALRRWRLLGPWDVIVCDAVLNSVTSQAAEAAVMATLAAFGKLGARVYFGGRSRSFVEENAQREARRSKSAVRHVEFLDEHGLTAIWRRGEWFFQKYHRADEVRRLCSVFLGDEAPILTELSATWKCTATLRRRPSLDVLRAALAREFELPWPDGRTVGRSREALASLEHVAARWRYER